ncbi:MAG: FHA domain-containing protein [Eubacterium sp.]|nr:FHA domain-containing protein [Eubacterium sp.]
MKRETILNIRYGMQTYSYTLEEYLEEGKSEVTIGRGMDCDIVIRNMRVAEKHGVFFLGQDGWVYRDLGSDVGSSMNGQRIKYVKIFNGSTIALEGMPTPDTLYIDITIKNDGLPTVPGMRSVNDLNNSPTPMGYFGGASSGYAATPAGRYGGASANQHGSGPAMNYGNDPGAGNLRAGAAGGQYGAPAGGAYSGGSGRFTNLSNGVAPGGTGWNSDERSSTGRMESSLKGLNAFGLGAAMAWSIIGVVYLINFFRTISVLDSVNIFCNFSNGIMIVAMFVMYLITVAGTVLLPIALFTYRKKSMFLGSEMVAAGFTGMIVADFLLLMITLGSLFWYLFDNLYSILMLVVIAFNLASLISLAMLFKKNANMEKVGTKWYRPIIYFALSWVMVFVAIGAASSEAGSLYGASLNLTDSLPMDNIWMNIAWFAAVILSCVYIHVDEDPRLAQKFEVKSR